MRNESSMSKEGERNFSLIFAAIVWYGKSKLENRKTEIEDILIKRMLVVTQAMVTFTYKLA